MNAHPLLFFGFPEGAAAWSAATLATLLFLAPRSVVERIDALARRHRRLTLGALALFSALLSRLYFSEYLGGGPRVIDATAYLLEGRIFRTGNFTFHAPDPASLFQGRFLLNHPTDPGRIGVIFPPGYPLLLAFGECLGSYEIVGPILAALLLILTYQLALFVTKSETTALLAGIFSALSACLHYHTADTMSHAWSACLGVFAALRLLELKRAVRQEASRSFLFARAGLLGLALGWLLATRQLTGIVFLAVVLFAFVFEANAQLRKGRPQSAILAGVSLGLLPGIALLLAYHHSLTGNILRSPQSLYYAVSDGPLGCFGLGFGKGCEFEHGDLYRAWGGQGLGLFEMVKNTWRRLHHHSLDLAQCELLALLGFAYLLRTRRRDFARLTLLLGAGLVLAYAFFYFDGSYPGAGARFFFELLPFEFVALASAARLTRRAPWIVAVALLGFACHTRPLHESYRTEPQGRPYLLEKELKELTSPVLFVDSDHAFLLGFRPLDERDEGPTKRVLVARSSGDFREAQLLHHQGTEHAVRLRSNLSTPRFEDWKPNQENGSELFLEAEGLWPAVEQRGLWAHPSYPVGSCVSRGRGLRLHPEADRPNRVLTLALDGMKPGNYFVRARLWQPGRECTRVSLGIEQLPAKIALDASGFPPGEMHLDGFELAPEANFAP